MNPMNRREFLRAGLAVAGAATLGSGCETAPNDRLRTPIGASVKRPNIVLILADDMGFSDLGCYGGEVQTPNLDRMAAGGARCTQFYNVARCCPTRASLLTGLYPHQAGIGHMTFGPRNYESYVGWLNDRCVTIAEALQLAGYRTAISGKWHVGGEPEQKPEYQPAARGFEKCFGFASDHFNPNHTLDGVPLEPLNPDLDEYYDTDAITDYAVHYIEEFSAGSAPYFLYVAYTAPHWPIQAWEEDIAKYREVYRKGWDRIREERYERMRRLGIIDPTCALTPRDESVPDWKDAENKLWYVERMAVYAAMIDRMDQGIGRILKAVEESGELENTLFLFLSDNGGSAESLQLNQRELAPKELQFLFPEFTRDGRKVRHGDDPSIMPGPADTWATYGLEWANVSNTPFRLYKQWLHEGGISTPLIAYWPGVIPEGGMVHQAGHVLDILPTCLDAARAKYPETYKEVAIQPYEGASLMPYLLQQPVTAPIHEWLFWEHQGNRGVRQGDWKAVSRYPDEWEIYNIAQDRGEMHNLYGTEYHRLNEMLAAYYTWAARCGVVAWDAIKDLQPLESGN